MLEYESKNIFTGLKNRNELAHSNIHDMKLLIYDKKAIYFSLYH